LKPTRLYWNSLQRSGCLFNDDNKREQGCMPLFILV